MRKCLTEQIRRGVAAVIATALLVAQAMAAYDMGAVAVSNVAQQNTNWCWAACGECILDFFDISVSQAEFARQVNGGLNVSMGDSDVLDGLNHWGVDGTIVADSISFNRVKSEINAGRPVYVGWTWNVTNGGHCAIVSGFDGTAASTGSVEYMDPGDGALHVVTYTTLVGGDGYTHVWNGTIYSLGKS